MDSHEVIKKAFEKAGPKEIAAAMGLSLSLVYKWAQPNTELGSGSRNPLDRVNELRKLTNELEIIQWLCHEAGGYYVPNPTTNKESSSIPFTPATNAIVQQFAGLLQTVTQAAVDNTIDQEEAERIRKIWDKLKTFTEGFVNACEERKFEDIRIEEPPPA
ncbi:MAG: phage regulatory CII family protein [Verrucomicrobiota bacterium]